MLSKMALVVTSATKIKSFCSNKFVNLVRIKKMFA